MVRFEGVVCLPGVLYPKQFSEVFPSFTKEFMIEVGNGDPVIFLDPDVTARIYDPDTNDYEIIDTSDADPAKAFVMVTGEASY